MSTAAGKKIAIVTGSALGLGYELARQLIGKGWFVAGIDFNTARQEELSRTFGADEYRAFVGDISDEAFVKDSVAAIKEIGHIDLPFNKEHYTKVLDKLHDKGDWVIRCFDCEASKVCNYSCPTSDANSDVFKEHDCQSTKMLYQYFCENETRVHKLHERLLRKRYEMARQQPAAE